MADDQAIRQRTICTLSKSRVTMRETDRRFDALVIGAGFSGLYMLHRLRELGLRTRVLEMAENVGGTWLYNRYPGARCDIESIEYSYSFSDEIQQEWVWTETMPAQPEVEAYLKFVADRLELRRDIQFDTKVVAMGFDEQAAEWVVRTESGESFVAPFVIAASGILSAPLEPDIPGRGTSPARRCSLGAGPGPALNWPASGSGSSAPARPASSSSRWWREKPSSSSCFSDRRPIPCPGGCAGSSPASWTA